MGRWIDDTDSGGDEPRRLAPMHQIALRRVPPDEVRLAAHPDALAVLGGDLESVVHALDQVV